MIHATAIPMARKTITAALLAFFFACAAGTTTAQDMATLESILGAERFRAMGLNKLNEAELSELLRWLRSEGIGSEPAPAVAAPATDSRDARDDGLRATLLEAQQAREALEAEIAAARAAAEEMRERQAAAMAAAEAAEARRHAAEREADEANQDVTESRLVEPFTGWDGKTVFQLENGQLWRQRLPGRYIHRAGDLPRVRITRNVMGYHEMELLGYKRKIGVSRVHR